MSTITGRLSEMRQRRCEVRRIVVRRTRARWSLNGTTDSSYMQGPATLPGKWVRESSSIAVDVLCLASIECVQNAAEKRREVEMGKDMIETLKSSSPDTHSQQPDVIFYIVQQTYGDVARGDCSMTVMYNSQGVLPRRVP